MKNTILQTELSNEVRHLVEDRKSLMLATLGQDHFPYASYAPFAVGNDCFYVLISEIAIHALNLIRTPKASVLIIEDEDTADELFARVRVNYAVSAQRIDPATDQEAWSEGLDALEQRHGVRPRKLGALKDFHLFRLVVEQGRFVRGFGQAYQFEGPHPYGMDIVHLRDGHKPRNEDPETQQVM